MRYPGRACLVALAALALTMLAAGCMSASAVEASPPRPAEARRGAVPPQYRLVVREDMSASTPCLAAELIRVESPASPGATGAAEGTTPATRRWRFHPEFFLLPLAPVRTAAGLAGAGGLVVGFVSTYAVRWAAGTSAAGVCVVAGCAAAAGQAVVGKAPAEGPILAWAKAPWEWAWDSTGHARLWGVQPGTEESALDHCMRFAFDYSRYAPSPFFFEGQPPAPGVAPKEGKSTEAPRPEPKSAPCAIKELVATVRAKPSDLESLLLTASPKLPASGEVLLPLKPALDAFCHDDELSVDLVAIPAADPTQRVSAAKPHVTPVARWRKPTGPHIRWLAPEKVVPGDAGPNPVSQKELVVRVRLRADTPDAPITMWQIKQDGKVRGGAFSAPGRPDLGRDVRPNPEAKMEFGQPGERTTLEVVVEASDGQKSSSTATFVFSPSP